MVGGEEEEKVGRWRSREVEGREGREVENVRGEEGIWLYGGQELDKTVHRRARTSWKL